MLNASNFYMSGLSPIPINVWEVHYTANPPACSFDLLFDRTDIQTQDNPQNSWFDKLFEDKKLQAVRSSKRLVEKQHGHAFCTKSLDPNRPSNGYPCSVIDTRNTTDQINSCSLEEIYARSRSYFVLCLVGQHRRAPDFGHWPIRR